MPALIYKRFYKHPVRDFSYDTWQLSSKMADQTALKAQTNQKITSMTGLKKSVRSSNEIAKGQWKVFTRAFW